jgi:hypothetical protein
MRTRTDRHGSSSNRHNQVAQLTRRVLLHGLHCRHAHRQHQTRPLTPNPPTHFQPTHPPTHCCRVVPAEGGGYDVTLRQGRDGPEQQLHTGLVMMATGRGPKTQGLGLEVRGKGSNSARWGWLHRVCS